jgi:hypothetical protein
MAKVGPENPGPAPNGQDKNDKRAGAYRFWRASRLSVAVLVKPAGTA